MSESLRSDGSAQKQRHREGETELDARIGSEAFPDASDSHHQADSRWRAVSGLRVASLGVAVDMERARLPRVRCAMSQDGREKGLRNERSSCRRRVDQGSREQAESGASRSHLEDRRTQVRQRGCRQDERLQKQVLTVVVRDTSLKLLPTRHLSLLRVRDDVQNSDSVEADHLLEVDVALFVAVRVLDRESVVGAV